MSVPTNIFFIGLALIVIGTGLLKPNVSSMVGDLYPEGGAKRDAGFSIFYMGINFGAMLGPLLCGLLGEGITGIMVTLAGFGMVLGLISYQIGGKYIGTAGDLKVDVDPETLAKRSKIFYTVVSIIGALSVLLGFLVSSGAIELALESLAGNLGLVAVVITVAFFGYIIFLVGIQVKKKASGCYFRVIHFSSYFLEWF